jgi:hypothetical protein
VDVNALAGNSSAVISWSAPKSDGGSAINYYIATVVQKPSLTCKTTGHSCSISGLTNRTSYSFKVSAHNAVGLGPVGMSGLVTPKAQPVVALRMSGQGDQSGPEFTIPATATQWTESWTYNCSSFGSPGNFITSINGLDGTVTYDIGANELGNEGSGTNHYFDHGHFNIQVTSECSWTDTLTYYPPGS